MIRVNLKQWLTSFKGVNNNCAVPSNVVTNAIDMLVFAQKLKLDTNRRMSYVTGITMNGAKKVESSESVHKRVAGEKLKIRDNIFYKMILSRNLFNSWFDRAITPGAHDAMRALPPSPWYARLVKGAVAALFFIPEALAFGLAKIPSYKSSAVIQASSNFILPPGTKLTLNARAAEEPKETPKFKNEKSRIKTTVKNWSNRMSFTKEQNSELQGILNGLLQTNTKLQFNIARTKLVYFHRKFVEPALLKQKAALNDNIHQIPVPAAVETFSKNYVQPYKSKEPVVEDDKSSNDEFIESKYSDKDGNCVDKSLASSYAAQSTLFHPSKDPEYDSTIKVLKAFAASTYKDVYKKEGTEKEIIKAQKAEEQYYSTQLKKK